MEEEILKKLENINRYMHYINGYILDIQMTLDEAGKENGEEAEKLADMKKKAHELESSMWELYFYIKDKKRSGGEQNVI